MEKIRTIIVGVEHMHISMLYGDLAKYPDEVEFLGWCHADVADGQSDEVKTAFMKGALPQYDSMEALAALAPDLALVCCDNTSSAKTACYLLERGISVVLEKPMASTLADAEKILAAAEKSGAKLAVNWPVAWFPTFNKAKELCDAGVLGRVMRVTYRSPATWGPFSYSADGVLPPEEEMAKTWWYQKARGGGALLDYACYGAALSTWIFGHRAEKVKCLTKNFVSESFDIEDYSAMLLDFGNGIGLLEGSWATYNAGEVPSGPVIHGTEATLVCDRHSNSIKIYRGRTHPHQAPTEVIECPKSLPELNFARNLIAHLNDNEPLHPLLEPNFNADVMAALEMGRNDAEN